MTDAALVRKFTFDEDFDEPRPSTAKAKQPPPAAEPPPPPPPTYGAADLAKARTQAYQDGEKAGRAAGHKAGKAEAEAQIEQQMTQALQQIAAGIAALADAHERLVAARSREPLELTLVLIRHFWPELERRHGLDEIEGMLSACLADLIEEPKLVVKVPSAMLAELRDRVEALAGQHGFDGGLRVVGDDRLTPGACRVEWAGGGAERDTAELLARIDAAAQRLLTAD